MTQTFSPSRTRIEWIWKLSMDSGSSGTKEEWCAFSDVESMIIEEAFQRKLAKVSIDDYQIDLKKLVQISTRDENQQNPIKQNSKDILRTNERLREARFMPNPMNPRAPFIAADRLLGFVGEILQYFKLSSDSNLREPANRRLFVEKAAEGFIIEGKLVGKPKEAEWMARQLLKVKEAPDEVLWQCCVHLYTMESFLYKKMNEYMRLGGDEQQKELWRSKIPTFGPFAYLLSALTVDRNYKKITVYRGANLTDDVIEQYRHNLDRYVNFPAFTSTSRNQKKAEQFGNVLFVMDISSLDGSDVSPYSNYPNEEETLVKPDFAFCIQACRLDKIKKKWTIHLTAHRDD